MATHSTAARNAATDAVLALIGTSGNFKFRLAGIVAAPGTAVATLPFSATAFGASSSGTATANAITDDSSATGNASPVATGTFETSGGTIVVQCTVGVSGNEVKHSVWFDDTGRFNCWHHGADLYCTTVVIRWLEVISPVGDSYACASNEHIRAGRSDWLNAYIITSGDSLVDETWDDSGLHWARALARSPVIVDRNAGKAGDTIEGLTARWAADVAAYSPKLVETRIGTNNVDGGATADIGTFPTKYQPIIDWHVTNNVRGILHAIPPEVGTPGDAIMARNGWIAAQCAAHPGLLYFADDSWGLASDAGYTADATKFLDGTHMNGWGNWLQANAMKPLIKAIFGSNEIRLLDPTDTTIINSGSNQHVNNPHNYGTGGTVGAGISGTLPDSWSVERTGTLTADVSIVSADVSDPVQIPWIRMTPTSGAVNASLVLAAGMTHPSYAGTEAALTRLDGVAEIRFVGFDPAKFTSLRTFTQTSFSWSGGWHTLIMAFPVVLNEVIVIRHGWRRNGTGWWNQPEPVTSNTLKLHFLLNVGTAFSSSQGSIDIRCASVRGLQA